MRSSKTEVFWGFDGNGNVVANYLPEGNSRTWAQQLTSLIHIVIIVYWSFLSDHGIPPFCWIYYTFTSDAIQIFPTCLNNDSLTRAAYLSKRMISQYKCIEDLRKRVERLDRTITIQYWRSFLRRVRDSESCQIMLRPRKNATRSENVSYRDDTTSAFSVKLTDEEIMISTDVHNVNKGMISVYWDFRSIWVSYDFDRIRFLIFRFAFSINDPLSSAGI